jgi:hypothetical protein
LKYPNRMLRLLQLIIGLLVFQEAIQTQPLVGMKKEEIITYMRQYEPDFALDLTVVNKKYNYLKYFDKTNEETILCFLSDINECNLIRRMSDYSNLELRIKKLNKAYKSVDKDKWVYTINNEEFMVNLKREKWYFTLETRRKK